MMRALVVGASGFVGEYLHVRLTGRGHQVWGTFHSSPRPGLVALDVLDRKRTAALVRSLRPDVVFHPAAVANVDWCERFPEASFLVNVTGLGHVVEAAVSAEARVVLFSTEYVFDGADGPYSEEDVPRPLSAYGRQKRAGEALVLDRVPGGLVVRTTVVYGWERRGKNFVERLLAELSAGRAVRVPVDQVSSPTYVVDLVDAACDLAEQGCAGIYHVAGAERADRRTFALAVANAFGLDGRLVVGVPTAELGQKAPRPLEGGLDVEKIRQRLGWAPAGFREGLARMKREKELWQGRWT